MEDTHKVRTVLAVVLIVAGCLLAPVAVTAAWARTHVTNTERYVDTVAPLAADSDVRNAVADQVTEVILRNLPDRITSTARGVVRGQVGQLVESDTFQSLWRRANQAAHGQLIDLLTGRGPANLNGDTVSIDLGPFVAAARDRLVASGFAAAQRIPDVQQSFAVFSSADLPKAQQAYRLLDRYGAVLPFVAGGLLVLGLGVAVRRRRTLIGIGLGTAASMVVLGIVLLIGRQVAPDRLPDGFPATAVFDVVTRSLWTTLVVIFVIGAVVAGAALVATRLSRPDRTAGSAVPPGC
ncbi:hypothetical protein [Kribbella karoonensis]|uniref:Integral membrane protein n=1 Tax=Kribbella karoonensis TaxID=324851 RepID=A0ABN2EAG1_9ACTN